MERAAKPDGWVHAALGMGFCADMLNNYILARIFLPCKAY